MKPTKRSSKPSSGEKIKSLVKKQANLKKSNAPSAPLEDTKKSTVTQTPSSPPETLVENKPLDGSMRIDNLPFQAQANIVFNPLISFNQKQVVGKADNKDPFAPAAFVVERKK